MNGFGKYREMFRKGEILPGQTIEIHGKPGGVGSGQIPDPYSIYMARIVDEMTLEPAGSISPSRKARNALQGREWYIVDTGRLR